MSGIIEAARMYIVRSLSYLIWAVFFGLVTYVYWFFAPNMFTAYAWNIVGISAVIVMDKIRTKRVYKEIKACTDDKILSKLRKKDVLSIKTPLYLFYIFILFSSHALAMVDMDVSDNIRGYFQSVSHGVLFLFALDNFTGYLISDDERVRKFKDKYKGNTNG